MDARCKVVAMPVAFCSTAFGTFLGGCRLKLDRTANQALHTRVVDVAVVDRSPEANFWGLTQNTMGSEWYFFCLIRQISAYVHSVHQSV